jgi:hypothetical protein
VASCRRRVPPIFRSSYGLGGGSRSTVDSLTAMAAFPSPNTTTSGGSKASRHIAYHCPESARFLSPIATLRIRGEYYSEARQLGKADSFNSLHLRLDLVILPRHALASSSFLTRSLLMQKDRGSVLFCSC